MERKSAKVLIKLILRSISESPKSIYEIANEVDSNWESIKQYLESLKEANIVKETEIGNKRVFSKAPYKTTDKNSNLFDNVNNLC